VRSCGLGQYDCWRNKFRGGSKCGEYRHIHGVQCRDCRFQHYLSLREKEKASRRNKYGERCSVRPCPAGLRRTCFGSCCDRGSAVERHRSGTNFGNGPGRHSNASSNDYSGWRCQGHHASANRDKYCSGCSQSRRGQCSKISYASGQTTGEEASLRSVSGREARASATLTRDRHPASKETLMRQAIFSKGSLHAMRNSMIGG
jgi:hypothetical protein